MALIFNGKKFTPKTLPEFPKDKNGNELPVVFKLWKTRMSWNKLNNRMDIPSAFVIDPFFQFTEKDESGLVRYYEHQRPGKQGGKDIQIFEPDSYKFDELGELRIYPGKRELLWLMQNYPQNAEKTTGGREPWFYEEDKVKEAKLSANKSTMRAKAMQMIWGPTGGMNDNELFEVAKQLKIVGIDNFNSDELKLELEKIAQTKPDTFIAICEGALMKVKSIIFKALEAKVIDYNETSRTWSRCDENGKPTDEIMIVKAGSNYVEMLIDWLNSFDTKGTFTYIKTALANKKAVPV